MAQDGRTRKYEELSGTEKVAVLFLCVKPERAKQVSRHLEEEEHRDIAHAMSSLGNVEPDVVERVLSEYGERINGDGSVVGSPATTQQVLSQILSPEWASEIMAELSGPEGKNIWQKLSNASDSELVSFLSNEHPQTMALVLTKIDAGKSGRVLAKLPENLSNEVIERMYRMESIDRKYRRQVESALSKEFLSKSTAQAAGEDNSQVIARIFNKMPAKRVETAFKYLEEADPKAAKKIRGEMFTFDDLLTLDGGTLRIVVNSSEQDDVAKALANAEDEVKERFYENMTERGARALRNKIDDMGRVRKRDAETARLAIIDKARELEQANEISLKSEEDEDEDDE